MIGGLLNFWCGKSRQEIYDLGFKPDRVVKLLRELKERFCAWENSNVTARDMVELRLKEKKVKLERKIGERIIGKNCGNIGASKQTG